MENNTDDANSKLFPANQPEKDLYTIPSYSGWFSWDDIHETEKTSLKEFFDNSSISRTPKIYKDYRDFIINKYREEPSRKLTFTEIRKSLVGDVTLIHKVFLFLEKWGLINFGASSSSSDGLLSDAVEDERRQKFRFEEGAPNGVRVVSVPNSSKAMSLSSNNASSDVGEAVENGFRLPPLASYSDVFGDLVRRRGSVCVNCGEECVSGSFESEKESSISCLKCLKNGSVGESKQEDDFRIKYGKDKTDTQRTELWSDSETLLLLDSVSRHGDDWDLVAQNVHTKNKFDCISKIIQLPFGEPMLAELMMDNTNGNDDSRNSITSTDSVMQRQSSPAESQKPIKKAVECDEFDDEMEHVEDGGSESIPSKRRRITSFEEVEGSLMKQVAILSTVVSPNVAAAAAEAAFTTLCDEVPYGKGIFENEVDATTEILGFPSSINETERGLSEEKLETGDRDTQSGTQEDIPEMKSIALAFQIKTAIGTALGAAAAHAKLLADQEDREIEHLLATIIETQLRKLRCKMKHFEDLDQIMENEYNQIQVIKESILADRINVLRQALKAGISRWRDHTAVKSSISSIF